MSDHWVRWGLVVRERKREGRRKKRPFWTVGAREAGTVGSFRLPDGGAYPLED